MFTYLLLRESRGGRPGLPGPISPCGLCRCKATVNIEHIFFFHLISVFKIKSLRKSMLESHENTTVMAAIPCPAVSVTS